MHQLFLSVKFHYAGVMFFEPRAIVTKFETISRRNENKYITQSFYRISTRTVAKRLRKHCTCEIRAVNHKLKMSKVCAVSKLFKSNKMMNINKIGKLREKIASLCH